MWGTNAYGTGEAPGIKQEMTTAEGESLGRGSEETQADTQVLTPLASHAHFTPVHMSAHECTHTHTPSVAHVDGLGEGSAGEHYRGAVTCDLQDRVYILVPPSVPGLTAPLRRQHKGSWCFRKGKHRRCGGKVGVGLVQSGVTLLRTRQVPPQSVGPAAPRNRWSGAHGHAGPHLGGSLQSDPPAHSLPSDVTARPQHGAPLSLVSCATCASRVRNSRL